MKNLSQGREHSPALLFNDVEISSRQWSLKSFSRGGRFTTRLWCGHHPWGALQHTFSNPQPPGLQKEHKVLVQVRENAVIASQFHKRATGLLGANTPQVIVAVCTGQAGAEGTSSVLFRLVHLMTVYTLGLALEIINECSEVFD
jgi:hypothetical protein